MSDPLIQISNLTKVYKNDDLETVVLSDINLKISKGEFVAIMGPSGSGKSTLMHILGALDLPTSGSYRLEGQDMGRLSDDELARIRNRKIGFVFQAYNLLPRTSALDNVKVPMDLAGVPEEVQQVRAVELLTLVGLENRLNNPPNKLSGGQQQRVAIARSLVMDPAILLADEPTGNIATSQAEEIMEIFRELNRKGHTIIMITHEPDIAAFAKRIIHLRDGKIISDEVNFKNKPVKKA